MTMSAGTELDMKDARTRGEAAEVYEMRRAGKSIAYILDNTEYTSTYDVVQALKTYHAEQSLLTFEGRNEQTELEIARIDAVQDKAWEIMEKEQWKYDKEGNALEVDYDINLKAAKTVLECVKLRSQLLQLTETDISQASAAVLIVGGREADYVQNLINNIPEHSRPKDTGQVLLELTAHPTD